MNNYRQGSILITVIIVISISMTLAIYIFEHATKSYGIVLSQQNEYQGAIYAMTVTKALEQVFEYDNTARSDGPGDVWNLIPPIPVDNGFLTITLTPVNAKFPINSLANDNEEIRDRYAAALDILLNDNNMSPDIRYDIESYLGTGTLNSERIDTSSSPYNYKGAKLSSLAEAYYITSIGDDYNQLTEFVSLGDPNSKINLNFVSREIMVAIIPELEPFADAIIEAREESDLTDVSEIYNIIGIGSQDVYTLALNFFDVKSVYIYAKLELTIGDDTKFYHVLYNKNEKKVTPIKYIEGGSIDYF